MMRSKVGALIPLFLVGMETPAWAEPPGREMKLSEPFQGQAPRQAGTSAGDPVGAPPFSQARSPGSPAADPPHRHASLPAFGATPPAQELTAALEASPGPETAEVQEPCREGEPSPGGSARTGRIPGEQLRTGLILLRWALPPGLPPGIAAKPALVFEQGHRELDLSTCAVAFPAKLSTPSPASRAVAPRPTAAPPGP